MKITKKIAERLELRDDATEHGGKSYSDEKLDNFMAECEIPFGSSLKRVNKALVECGLLPFTKEDVEEVIDLGYTIFEVETEYKSGKKRTECITAKTEREMWKIYDKHHNETKIKSSIIYDAWLA